LVKSHRIRDIRPLHPFNSNIHTNHARFPTTNAPGGQHRSFNPPRALVPRRHPSRFALQSIRFNPF
jgi:hypothetical protein